MKIIQPTYITIQPSTNKKISFRPFVNKEYKALLLALQSTNIDNITEAIRNTIKVCTDNKIDPDNIPYYDTEYLFLQIRAKSIGETIELTTTCKCGEELEFTAEIDDIEINPKPHELKIAIEGTQYKIEVRHPSLTEFREQINGIDSDQTVAKCITKIYTDDEVMDWDMNEKIEFLESMTVNQQKKISEYMGQMPIVAIPTKCVCPKCGEKKEIKLSGYENFFV